MPKVVQRPFCTIYKRSESEKRVYNMTKEMDSLRAEVVALRKEIITQKSSENKGNKKKSSE